MHGFNLQGWQSNRSVAMVVSGLALFVGCGVIFIAGVITFLLASVGDLTKVLPYAALLVLLGGGAAGFCAYVIGAPWRGPQPRLLVADDYLILTHPGLGAPLHVERANVRSVTFGAVDRLDVAWIILGGRWLKSPHLVVDLEFPVLTEGPRFAIGAGHFAHALWLGGDFVPRFALLVDEHERLPDAFEGWPVVSTPTDGSESGTSGA